MRWRTVDPVVLVVAGGWAVLALAAAVALVLEAAQPSTKPQTPQTPKPQCEQHQPSSHPRSTLRLTV